MPLKIEKRREKREEQKKRMKTCSSEEGFFTHKIIERGVG
jgi:hypothetical protein